MALSIQAKYAKIVTRFVLRRRTRLPRVGERYYSAAGFEYIVVGFDTDVTNGFILTYTFQRYEDWNAERRML